jgi:hypothetical protein
LSDFFDPDDVSNVIKIAYLSDYRELFSSPLRLLFGYGLGSLFFSGALNEMAPMTELTYFDLIRNYGLIIGFLYMAFLLFPLNFLKNDSCREYHYLFLAYGFYLLMSSVNPFLFSSSGLIIISIVYSVVFQLKKQDVR